MLTLIIQGAVIGFGGTAAMDVWAILLNRFAGQNLPNWGNVGRWFGHLRRRRVFHDDIGAAEAIDNELRLGWAAHYLVGIVYGSAFGLIVGAGWFAAPAFFPAWVFAIVTVAAGWFLLQPGMGLGWAASKTADPWKVRGMNLAAHTVFGLGMWVTGLLMV